MPEKDKRNSKELRDDVSGFVQRLAEEVDSAKKSEIFKKWLDWQSNLHNYSFMNTILIAMVLPNATRCASYKTWLKNGRHVKRGEHGAKILVPYFRKELGEDGVEHKVLSGFGTGTTFDVSQTEGDEIPTLTWYGNERDTELESRLQKFCDAHGIKVERTLNTRAQGVSQNKRINLKPDASTKTWIHEIAHELLHWDGKTGTREQCECEAEGVAYVVCKAWGLETVGSDMYLANWTNPETIRNSLKVIASTAKTIIGEIEKFESDDEE